MIAEERSIPVVEFTFLGFTFKARDAKTRWGRTFPSFQPGISQKAKKQAGEKLREMNIRNKTQQTLQELRKDVNDYTRGMMNYYGKFYKSATYGILQRMDWLISEWVRKKYRRTRKEVRKWLRNLYRRDKELFVHWKYIKPKYAKGLRTIRAV